MRAIIAEEKRAKIIETEQPVFRDDECLVSVHSCGVNRADLLQIKGVYPPPEGVTSILGLEFSGVVDEVGKVVTRFKKGDKVCGIVAGGAYAEWVPIKADHLIPIPENLSFQEAAAIPEVFITAYQALFHIGNLSKDQHVLIHAGASGVGSAGIQLAKSIGAKVTVTASAGKHEHCYDLGADQCIDYKSTDFAAVVSDVDVVFDLIGASYFERNLKVLAEDGVLVMIGFLGGVKCDALNIANIISKRLRIEGSTLRNRSSSYKKELIHAFQTRFIPEDHFSFSASIDQIFDFADVEKAHQYMKENRNAGKIVLSIR